MKKIVQTMLANKGRTMPILSFPAAQLLGVSVKELISSPTAQRQGMLAIADRCPVAASLNMMDLSVEAEAFGAEVRFADDEVPTVTRGVLTDIGDAASLAVPTVGVGRTGVYIEGIRLAKEQITDRPVFCGVIGPFSLAGRLLDMSELMMACYDSPDEVKSLLDKVTAFLTDYVKAFREAGADGVVMAEPAAGLLPPALAEEFSLPYVQAVFEAVNEADFVLCYHNCGNAVVRMLDSLATLPADIFHFGNAIELKDTFAALPADAVVMGNVDPVLLQNGTPEGVRAEVERVFNACHGFPNFMLSTGCDVPAAAKWENIDAYFERVTELYA